MTKNFFQQFLQILTGYGWIGVDTTFLERIFRHNNLVLPKNTQKFKMQNTKNDKIHCYQINVKTRTNGLLYTLFKANINTIYHI